MARVLVVLLLYFLIAPLTAVKAQETETTIQADLQQQLEDGRVTAQGYVSIRSGNILLTA